MMKNVRTLFPFALAVALSAGAVAMVGCGGSVEQPQTQASAGNKAPVAPQTHGVVKMFGEALGEVALRPEQRTELEKLAVAADARHASMSAGKKDLMLALADQVEKGAIDKAALQPNIDRIVADLEKGRPEDSAALARLHAILDPEQRNAFVDAIESRFKGKHHGGKHHDKGAKGEHAERGEHAQRGEHGDKPEHHGGRMGGMRGMLHLAQELQLTSDQKSQIKDALKSAHEGRGPGGKEARMAQMGQGKKAMESFRTETFDANAAAPSPEKLRAQAAVGSGRFIGLAEKLLPILTPEQRKLAADKLRQMANSGADLPFAR